MDNTAKKTCDGCAMCCMILSIPSLDKPRNVWCRHCSTRKSCDIYDSRPNECRSFHCGWLSFPELGDEWKPSHSKIVIAGELNGRRLTAYVDPARPDAWRQEPYYSTFKKWAAAAAPAGGQVIVAVDQHMHAIFPDHDADLGVVTPDQRIITGYMDTPYGLRLDAIVVGKDDPRAKALEMQGRVMDGKKSG